MGYYSTFSGCYTPDKEIPSELVQAINGMNLDLRVKTEECLGDVGTGGEIGDVEPVEYEMKGYGFDRQLLAIVNLLSKHGVTLSGEVERVGEGSLDYERISARDGKVFVSYGEIKYGKEEEVKDKHED